MCVCVCVCVCLCLCLCICFIFPVLRFISRTVDWEITLRLVRGWLEYGWFEGFSFVSGSLGGSECVREWWGGEGGRDGKDGIGKGGVERSAFFFSWCRASLRRDIYFCVFGGELGRRSSGGLQGW